MFTLKRGTWYGWQMLPGYFQDPYYSPIKIFDVIPLKTGRGDLRIRFYNAFYVDGMTAFENTLRVIRRHEQFLVCDLPEYGQEEPRMAIITNITATFMRTHARGLLENHRHLKVEDMDIQDFMGELFPRA